ncbi:Aste57867_10814 [Aphanomyces stellatus]|uniref:Aste57867_10814 protein n=1 Tax=Aphanomyces stellatus TaxID=120398 RepID=A0A485KS24_9STRA|nr:hypothetical protein As57867_010774 [Aphanomyces stellatus]VFT87683.1 Aste57867_10814 [Aphanomyces stellatus]
MAPSMDAGMSPSSSTSAPVVDSKRLRRRFVDRERAREDRKRHHLHLDYLRGKIAELTQQLAANTTQLPWKDVAFALADATVETRRTNESLQARIEHNQRLLHVLGMYIQSCPSIMHANVRENCGLLTALSWQDHALLGQGDARAASYTWLTERLRHNIDAAISQCPNAPASAADVICHLDDHALYVVVRKHLYAPCSLVHCTNVVEDAYMATYRKFPRMDAELLYKTLGPDVEHVDFGTQQSIYRTYHVSPMRSVIVNCALSFDAQLPSYNRKPYGVQGWVAVDQVNAHACRILDLRVVRYALPTTADGFAELLRCPVDDILVMDDATRLDTFVQKKQREYDSVELGRQTRIFEALHRRARTG